MLLKAGIFLLILCLSITVGYEYNATYKARLDFFKSYESLLEYLIDQITFLKKDIPNAIGSFEENRCPNWLKIDSLSQEILESGVQCGWSNWRLQIADFYGLDNSQIEAIDYTPSYLGQVSSEKQLAHMKNNIKMLRQNIEDLELSLKTKCVTFKKVSLFLGIIIGLIII